ncbi:MAG: ACP S-malonyltransferase [Planctomycetota bacterium]
MSANGKPIAVLVCPGRGSYGKDELGSIARNLRPGPVAEALARADAVRRAQGLPTVSELDGAPAFRPSLHLQGQNAAELIYFATMAQAEMLPERYRIAGVIGNSLGWYTALAAAGCVSAADGWLLVTTMARLQTAAVGGQILTTTVDDDWRPDAERSAAVDATLAEVNALGDDHFVAPSIRLGGHAVLGGTERGVTEMLRHLPKIVVGEREFPFRLAGHGPFHTRLCTEVADMARGELDDLPIGMPKTHLIDGFGRMHSPWSADPQALLAYTVGPQVTETFDFTSSVRVALRELNPDVMLCAAPGNSLRAPVGHVVVREGYRGVRDRQTLFDAGLVVV